MVLGVEGTKAVLARHPELMAYLIYTDEKGQLATWASPSLSDYQ
jgi:thiamine biosynthesis lipoprotein